jgi:hypothetical protein
MRADSACITRSVLELLFGDVPGIAALPRVARRPVTATPPSGCAQPDHSFQRCPEAARIGDASPCDVIGHTVGRGAARYWEPFKERHPLGHGLQLAGDVRLVVEHGYHPLELARQRPGEHRVRRVRPAGRHPLRTGILHRRPDVGDLLGSQRAALARALAGEFEGVVAMFHDQANIARKLQPMSERVTLFEGLPVPGGTTAHGVAYDIAGRGIADPGSLRAALEGVIRLSTT